jgi:5-methylcytosine-specific restriction endonuclease McrA
MDGDHVVEIQTGGKDVLENLWPLDASTNRRAGSQISRTRFDIGGKPVRMSQLKKQAASRDVWLQIVSTK